MTATTKSVFAIRRQPTKKSVGTLTEIDHSDRVELEPRPVPTLGLSLVAMTEVYNNMRRNHTLANDLAENHWRIFSPVFKTSLESYEFPVEGVEYMGRSMAQRAIVLMLGDPDGILAEERRHYIARTGPNNYLGDNDFSPHITIAYVDLKLASQALLASFTDIPPSINLRPVTSTYPEFLPDKMQFALGLKNGAGPKRTTRKLRSRPRTAPKTSLHQPG